MRPESSDPLHNGLRPNWGWRYLASVANGLSWPLMPGASVLSILLMLECAATGALYTAAR